MYISLILVSTVLFSLSFLFKSNFQEKEGNTLAKAMVFSAIGNFIGIITTLFMGVDFSFTWFSFILAIITAVISIIFSVVSIKALAVANLTVFSLFSMLGGMLLPFVFSIAFYDERLTISKIICVCFVIAALILGTPKSDSKKNKTAIWYYIGVFVTNGMVGVMAKIHQSGVNAVSSNAYTFMHKTINFAISAVIVIILLSNGEDVKLYRKATSLFNASGSAMLNTIGNLFLLYALLHVDASVQYPLVTGGVIVVALIIDFIKGEKPNKKAIISAILSVIGMCLLVV